MAKKPIYIEIYETLKKSILDGTYKDGDFLPTEKDLQEKFFSSRITIRSAMKKLLEDGYIKRIAGHGTFVDYNKFGTGDASSTNSIGVVLCNLSGNFGVKMLVSIEETARHAGFSIIFKNSHDDVETESQVISELLSFGVKGILIQPIHNQYYNEQIIKLHINGFPVVLIDRQYHGFSIPAISTNNHIATEKTIEYLFKKGHNNIAFLSADTQHTSTLNDRLSGFKSAFLINSKLITAKNMLCNFICPSGQYTEENREKDINNIIEFINSNPDTTCFFASEYIIAHLTVSAIKRLNKKIPDDYSLVMFDEDDNFSEIPISHIRQDQYTMGKIAVEILIKSIRKETISNRIFIPHSFIEGKSVKHL